MTPVRIGTTFYSQAFAKVSLLLSGGPIAGPSRPEISSFVNTSENGVHADGTSAFATSQPETAPLIETAHDTGMHRFFGTTMETASSRQSPVSAPMFLPPFLEFFLKPEILEQSAWHAMSYAPMLLGLWLVMKGITPGWTGDPMDKALEKQKAQALIQDSQSRPGTTLATTFMKGALYLTAGFAALQVMQGHYMFEDVDFGPGAAPPPLFMAGMGLVAYWAQCVIAFAGFEADKIRARLTGGQNEFSPEYHAVAKALDPSYHSTISADWQKLTEKNLGELSLVADKFVLQAHNTNLEPEYRVRMIQQLRSFASLFGSVDAKPLLAKTLPLCWDDQKDIRDAAIELHRLALSIMQAETRRETLREIYGAPLAELAITNDVQTGRKNRKTGASLKRRATVAVKKINSWRSSRGELILNRHIQLIIALLPNFKLEEAEDALRAVYAAKPSLKTDVAFSAQVLAALPADLRDQFNLEELKSSSAFGANVPIRFASVRRQTTDAAKFTAFLSELEQLPPHTAVALTWQPFKSLLREFSSTTYRTLAIVRFADWAAQRENYSFGAVLAEFHDEVSDKKPKRQIDHDTGRLAQIGELIRFSEATLDEIGYFDPAKSNVVDPGFLKTDAFHQMCAYDMPKAVDYLAHIVTVLQQYPQNHDMNLKMELTERLIALKHRGLWLELAESDPDAMNAVGDGLSRLLRQEESLIEAAERFDTARPESLSRHPASAEPSRESEDDPADRARRARFAATSAAQRRPS